MVAKKGAPLTLICAAFLAAALPGAGALALESPWIDGYKARTRLLAGREGPGEAGRLLAFVEIALPPGWKTYWSNPGDAGGLPPTFDWTQSTNLASATVLYPAPKRMTDRSGTTIGYKDHVIFPVVISSTDPKAPIGLALSLAIGVCKDICVPIDAALALDVPPEVTDSAPAAALEALNHVPRSAAESRPQDPKLARVEPQLTGAEPKLVLDATFAGDTAEADLFLEAPEGTFIAVPVRSADRGEGKLTFEVDLGGETDLSALKGKTLKATLVGKEGASVATFAMPSLPADAAAHR